MDRERSTRPKDLRWLVEAFCSRLLALVSCRKVLPSWELAALFSVL
jgi:hypothetical protein